MKNNNFDNVNSIVKMYLQEILQEGDICIDATMGNGYDAVYLAEKVGVNGFVYAFDVQKEAIESTKKKIEKLDFEKRVSLILDGHENIDKYVDKNIKCAVFNLGYLPRCEHKIITKPETTLKAIKESLNLLEENGIICISIYTGHDGGMEERNAIFDFAMNLEQKKYNVFESKFINQKNNPPSIIVIEKKKQIKNK
ncbi:tRNA (mnm(5)s(2)U34)-methyltransferase [Peptacetobacter sp.]|uniref:tRNA (mnm(5)s(2)U34)-methyltransferase n=1 Tax=Peptacetobacter sp. TaxID=2991975 RepID=UPI002611D37D|nr:class I SAM-dependent methyltransferase [Peptacetobacter sp.]